MPKQDSPAINVRRMVRGIIEHHFKKPARRISVKSGGLTNHVFEVKHDEGDFIVRISEDRAKINSFIKEQWATAKAREVGVPTPEILEVGNEAAPLPYMVARQVRGDDATHHPGRMRILHEMGHFTALIHTIRTTGFGQTFDWSSNQLSRNESWAHYLHGEFGVAERIQLLRRRRMLTAPQAKRIADILRRTEKGKKEPVLHHGDMRLKNVLADSKGTITAIIDWEHALSSIAPYWDLSLALHDLSIDGKEEFLSGYGVSLADFKQMVPVIRAFNILNYAPVVEKLAHAKNEKQLAIYRSRLAGLLDLYSL